ncbi:hypothetical protein BU23DRAFT_289095 [Bimuria novae-zelandiae CBS 107.79]|uniref:Uncharacterized protein n=1 Tax=Bimuria novae-zelandiae CBS 107.79 TaxID=1447943 RepID=A0A6A5US72_9PLEO|nr:hypothetical protein BU23DRAFT_289095 [Bimuria novae-zelandiae CBS 107.79]
MYRPSQETTVRMTNQGSPNPSSGPGTTKPRQAAEESGVSPIDNLALHSPRNRLTPQHSSRTENPPSSKIKERYQEKVAKESSVISFPYHAYATQQPKAEHQ